MGPVARRCLPLLLPALLLLSLAGPSSASPGWVQKAPTPAAGGYGEAAVGTGSHVYVVRCYSSTSSVQFWRYDPSSDSWSSLSTAGLASGTFRNGTALAWDGGDYLYALAGAKYEDSDRRIFLRYRISTDTWERLENTPGPQGAGDALAWSGWDNRLYALLGSSGHGTVFTRWSPPPAGGCWPAPPEGWTTGPPWPGREEGTSSLSGASTTRPPCRTSGATTSNSTLGEPCLDSRSGGGVGDGGP